MPCTVEEEKRTLNDPSIIKASFIFNYVIDFRMCPYSEWIGPFSDFRRIKMLIATRQTTLIYTRNVTKR